ncbi:MAG: phosphoribosylformylglycinamidine synthase subunit PurS [Chloroflexi bacterium]|nr:MAG: phosphoribosylformylglycinamidine synthase subunit PurS [Chloroflexota bacterium]
MNAGDASVEANRQFLIEVFITPRPVVNDPQGLAVRDGLHQLGYAGVVSVRVGKYLRLHLEATSEAEAHVLATEMCDKLLANPVIEDYRLSVSPLIADATARD